MQDLNNSVRLVKNKRTFVRFHVRSTSGQHWTYAALLVQRGFNFTLVYPVNGFFGFVKVRTSPDRGVLNHSFLFELPTGYKEGNVTMWGLLNPVLSWRGRSPLETTYANNTAMDSVSFERVPRVNLVLYRVGYRTGGTTYYPSTFHTSKLRSWLRRAYPLHSLWVWNRSYYHGTGRPTCGQVNSRLYSKKIWDILFHWSIPFGSRYYGMVDDGGGFMRGCAMGIPAFVASGPTGSGTWGWDTDGSYGDWYGGHELGHTYGRGHANFCGAGGGPPYPYTGGRISPTTWMWTTSTIYGFDIGNWNIYNANWRDVMSYCNNQWMGDFTSEGLMNYFQGNPVLASEEGSADEPSLQQQGPRLLVMGSINVDTNEVTLDPLFVIPDAEDALPRDEEGSYAIVLRDEDGNELARYPFTPDEAHAGPVPPGEEGEDHFLIISELVPYIEGTARVDIEGPGGTVLASVSAGIQPPEITLTSPNGGEVLDEETIMVEWTASDPDGDPLSFNVQYSPDNGETWEMIAQDITETSVELDSVNIVSGEPALFRVWASDGINTTSDASDAPFTVPNHAPTVEIVQPEDGATIAYSQTIAFDGDAYDIDTGTMEDEQLSWSSDLQGPLGTGAQLTIATLVTGTHTITFQADDGEGGTGSDTVQVTVLGHPAMAPAPADRLSAGPEQVIFDPATDVTSATLSVDNLSGPGATPIPWNATASEAWVSLSETAGMTPDTLEVSFDGDDLPSGTHHATITFASPYLPDEETTVQVTAFIPAQPSDEPGQHIYLPLIRR
jgi:hypothetical protein